MNIGAVIIIFTTVLTIGLVVAPLRKSEQPTCRYGYVLLSNTGTGYACVAGYRPVVPSSSR